MRECTLPPCATARHAFAHVCILGLHAQASYPAWAHWSSATLFTPSWHENVLNLAAKGTPGTIAPDGYAALACPHASPTCMPLTPFIRVFSYSSTEVTTVSQCFLYFHTLPLQCPLLACPTSCPIRRPTCPLGPAITRAPHLLCATATFMHGARNVAQFIKRH